MIINCNFFIANNKENKEQILFSIIFKRVKYICLINSLI